MLLSIKRELEELGLPNLEYRNADSVSFLGEDEEEEECGVRMCCSWSAVAKELCCTLEGKGCTGNPVMG